MPNLVGTGGTNADFRFGGMNTFPRSPPVVNPDQPVPGRRRGEDLAQPLCEQSQRPGRHIWQHSSEVTVFFIMSISAGVDGDDLDPGRLEPPVSHGAGDASTDCVLDIAGRLDKFTKAMVMSA